MAAYSIARTFQRLRQRLGANLWLMIRLIGGFTLLCISVCFLASAQQVKSDDRYTMTNLKRLVTVERDGSSLVETTPDEETMRILQDAFLDVAFCHCIIGDLFITSGEQIGVHRYLVCPREILSELGATEAPTPEEQEALLSAIQSGMIPEKQLAVMQTAFESGDALRLAPSALASNVIGLRYVETDYDGPIWLFVSDQHFFEYESVGSRPLCYAYFGNQSAEQINQQCRDIHCMLSLEGGERNIQLLDADEKVTLSVEKASSLGQQIVYVAAIILVVVLIGIVGSYLIICDHRQQEFGILIGMGVPKLNLMLELLLENIILFGLSALISNLLCAVIVPHASFPGLMTIRMSGMAVAASMTLGFVLSCLVAMIGLRKLAKLSPAMILKGE